MTTKNRANRGLKQSCAKRQCIHLGGVNIRIENAKIIDNYERYLITIDGNVYDTKRDKFLGTWVDTVGYRQCYLRGLDGKKHGKRIHRLLALAFIPNPENLPQVNHKDGNKLNNNIDNLEWVSNATNTQHGYDIGMYHSKHRNCEINVYHKNTHEFYKRFYSIRSMCVELGINRKTVTMILKHEKLTNNYNYIFEYADERQETIESIA